MPITINPSESKETFVQRCIGEEISNGKTSEQSVAICNSYWNNSKMSSQESMVNKMNKRTQELEGACWDNYIQIGMKPGKGGKRVPNCVGPIKD